MTTTSTNKTVDRWLNEMLDADDELLKTCVREIKEFVETGILKDGEVRKISRLLFIDFANIPMYNCSQIVQRLVIEKAAFKWAGV